MLKDRVVAAIGDEFDVGVELGRGGMSVVYRALDLRLMRQVAIKVLPPEFAYDSGIRERFRREAQMAAQLNHPHIIPIFSVDERDGVVYFVMAVCEGESLAARLARTNRSPLADVRRILAEVSGALAYAHGKGVVHRDIKPDNILIERDSGRALVTDFGIARAAEGGARLTVTGIAMGTPAYMSPEQALGDHELDGRSDVYSLGAVAYQMIAGVTPFTASNAPSLLLKHVSEELIPLGERRRDVPPRLADIVHRALHKKREQRWQNAGDLHAALMAGDVLDGISARHAPAPAAPVVRPQAVRPRAASHQLLAERSARMNSESASRGDDRDKAAMFEDWQRSRMAEIHDRIRGMRRVVPFAGALSLVLAFLSLLVTFEPDEEPFIFWLIFAGPTSLTVGYVISQARWLQKRGVSFFKALGARKTVTYAIDAPTGVLSAGLPLPAETLQGPFGKIVWQAIQDGEAIERAVTKLSPVDRKLLPDVLPTVKALVDRVLTLAPTLHDLEEDIDREDVTVLQARIARMEAAPEGSSDRTLQLLRRQLSTVNDLVRRREKLLSQIESAALLLHNIKLDLRKVGSSGVQSAMHDVNSATQEARALSRDISNVLSTAEDLRGM